MRLRSLLYVPGDRPERMEKAWASGADALIFDLEDAVAAEAKAAARRHVAAFLGRPRDRRASLIVRINPLDDANARLDVRAIAAARPDAIMLPKAEGRASIEAALRLIWAEGGDAPILPIAAETPGALFAMGEYAALSRRLHAITWGAEDLAASLGSAASRDAAGVLAEPLRVARAMALFAAHAAGVPGIETVFADFRNLAGLADHARAAARDGFGGMLAIHPTQVPIINAVFTPSDAEIAHARTVVRAFADQPGRGALQLDGKMIDAPHLKRAMALLERAS